jgi:MarR family transcriptional regulator, transcriptional regulator for hemolysin
MAAPAATEQDLMVLLSQTAHALSSELTAALRELGISPRAHCVLSKAMAGGQTQSRLAELAALDKTTMVVTVDELERAGLAERRTSSTDRRARIIEVTPAGEKLVAEGERIVSRVYNDVLSVLPPGEREAFVDALGRLVGGPLGSRRASSHSK